MKALVITRSAEIESASEEDMRTCLCSLDSLQIERSFALAETMPSDSAVNEFDFIVFPSLKQGFGTIIDDTGITIPMFGLGVNAAATNFGSDPGVSGSRGAQTDDFYDAVFTKSNYLAAYGGSYTLSGGTAYMTVSANEPSGTGGGAQANAGKVVLWSGTTGGGNNLYCSSLRPANHAMLPFLIEQAIKDGKLTRVARKAPVCYDLDHINGQYAHDEPGILDVLASYVPPGGYVWCGIQNANVAYFDNMDNEVRQKLRQYQNNPFHYTWHDHVESPLIGENLDGEGYTTDYTKTQLNTHYKDDEAIWNSKGLEFDPEYYNPGSNSWEENTIELFSSDTSIMSSAGNDTSQLGYGCYMFRQIGLANVSRPMETKENLYTNYYTVQRKFRGIQFMPTFDVAYGSDSNALDMPYNAVSDWRKVFNWITNAISMGQILYFHDEDIITADQDPGTDQHGIELLDMLDDMRLYMKDVTKFFANPASYVDRVEQ